MEYKNYTDIELITLLKEGKPSDNQAFNIIYFKYSSRFYGYCLYKAGNREEADELTQDSWMQFYRSVKAGKTTNNILPLLFTIARNLSINKFNQSKAKKNIQFQYLDPDTIDRLTNPFDLQSEIEKDELFKMIQLAINNLDEIYKEVVLMYWFGDVGFPDIAQICGISEAAARKRFERAVKQIDKLLKPYFI
jgi:RNA polymerase sigma-70 factor (ECF subfamily)